MQPDSATVPERLIITAAECSDAAENSDMTPLAPLVPSDRPNFKREKDYYRQGKC